MIQRGRSSTAALAVVTPLERVDRPRPPAELSDEQAIEWSAIVDRMPAEWFGRETHALLVQYCRHIVTARRVAQLVASIEAEDALDVIRYGQALNLQGREARILATLSATLRISQLSSYDKSQKKSAVQSRPWSSAT